VLKLQNLKIYQLLLLQVVICSRCSRFTYGYQCYKCRIGVQYNLDNLWKKNSSLLKAQAREKQLEANNELLNDQIKLEINKDYQNSVLAKKKIEVYEER
jgi:hypothetical protein